MQCNYFGKCGSCTLFEMDYETGLHHKATQIQALFNPLYQGSFDLIRSQEQGFRARVEFKIWHEGDTLSYAMHSLSKDKPLLIEACPIVAPSIAKLMSPLLESIQTLQMGHKLFNADFLANSQGAVIVTLIYHKGLDEVWQEKARELSGKLGISIIGRSRKQKIVIGSDQLIETLIFGAKPYHFVQIENSFTQPNPRVNEHMVDWVLSHVPNSNSDLLELYCGAGNFTLPLAQKFHRVLATEISKASINAARQNCELNAVTNITFVRMSSEEFVQAFTKVRAFNRMEGINLDDFVMKTVFVDPPRSGLDATTRALVKNFDTIIYISCNPQTLYRDLTDLVDGYTIEAMAQFDQFAYTHHMEMGAILRKKEGV